MIEVDALSKSYGPIPALREVSFQVAAGEIVGLLGPNGSGKTTLLRILTGFFPADAGSARVAGVRLSDDPFEVRRRVGYLPEQSPLYPEVSVRRFLRFAADVKLGDPERRDERVAAVIAECGLAAVQKRRIGTLSKGYRQRVGIAQALIGRPQVLVLDEPTAGLDPAQVLEVRQLIAALGGGTTVLLSSHVLADVASVCDRVLMLHLGRLVLAERIDTLRRQVRSSGELVLRTRASDEQLERLLSRVAEAEETRRDRASDGSVLLHLSHPARDGDEASRRTAERVTSALARACVEAGLPVLELGPRSRTLEDLFVDLLGERPQ
ncbi:MAG: ABC transporter ATP-binding protein [Thermodesulfobacteriota bacterium]